MVCWSRRSLPPARAAVDLAMSALLRNSACPGLAYVAGQCSECLGYLHDYSVRSASDNVASFHQLWTANAVGEMLVGSQDEPLPRERLTEALRFWTPSGTTVTTARLLEKNWATVRTWRFPTDQTWLIPGSGLRTGTRLWGVGTLPATGNAPNCLLGRLVCHSLRNSTTLGRNTMYAHRLCETYSG